MAEKKVSTKIDIVEPSVTLIEQAPGLEGMMKHIELIGRVSHRSEANITDDSCYKFVDNIIKMKHLSCIRHGTMYFTFPYEEPFKDMFVGVESPYMDVNVVNGHIYLTTNYQFFFEFLEGNVEDLWDYYNDEKSEFHMPRLTFEVITSIGVSREFNRHTTLAVLEESTRYVNYCKEKHGGRVKFCLPTTFDKEAIEKLNKVRSRSRAKYYGSKELIWIDTMESLSDAYNSLIKRNTKPQEARHVLPLSTATKVYYTTSTKWWKKFCELRSASNAHPDIRVLSMEIEKYL